MYMVERLDNQNWIGVFTGVAYGQESYVYEVPTLINDTENQDGTTSFRVIASMDEGNWASNVFEGFSTDDLAPSIPGNFMAEILDEYNVQLIWDNVPENDFEYYSLFRNSESNFDPNILEPLVTLSDTTYTDINISQNEYYYKISATDYNGNESLYAETSIELLSNDINPFEFSLEGCYPNPFNPVTTVKFTTPNISNVKIEVYNMNGQLTETLFSGNKSAGQHSIDWYANDNTSGLYLIRMSSGEFVETQKVMLLK